MRTQDEIIARINELSASGEDFMGFQRSDLVGALTFENARPWVRPEVTEDQWTTPETDDELRARATEYLTFAFGKAQDHRGISANRSVDHYRAWLWLLDLEPEGWDALDYVQYGVPFLFAAAEALGASTPTDIDLVNMSNHLPCEPGCGEGCG